MPILAEIQNSSNMKFKVVKVAKTTKDQLYVKLYSEGEVANVGILKVKSKGIVYFMTIEELPEGIQLQVDDYNKLSAKGDALKEIPEVDIPHYKPNAYSPLMPKGFDVKEKEFETDEGKMYCKWLSMTR